VHFCVQGHHYRFYGRTGARYGIRASRSSRRGIKTPKYLPHVSRTFRALFALPRKKCVSLQVKSARRTFRSSATTNSFIAKPRPDIELGLLGAYYRILKWLYIHSYQVGFRYYRFWIKSARRTFAPSTTTISSTAKQRPDTESGH
jgi:hypothetical protein